MKTICFILFSLLTTYSFAAGGVGNSGVEPLCVAPPRSVIPVQMHDVIVDNGIAYGLGTEQLFSYDVSDLENPVSLDSVILGSFLSKLLLDGTIIYCLTHDNKIISIDISDPNNMVLLTEYTIPIPSNPLLAFQIDFQMSGDVIYASYFTFTETRGMNMIDVSDPANLSFISRYIPPAGASTFSEFSFDDSGTYAFANSNNGITTLDISDPMNITETGNYNPWLAPIDFHELEARGNFLYASSGSEFYIFDITTPNSPTLLSTTHVGTTTSGGLSLEGDFAFVGDKYFDISNPSSPEVVFRLENLHPTHSNDLVGTHLFVDIAHELRIMNLEDCQLSCEVDFDGNNQYNYFDVSAFIHYFLDKDPLADLDEDGFFTFTDVSLFLELFNFGC